MAYVTPNPLPRNSADPVTACEAARAKQIVTNLENAVHQAYSASQQIAGPDSFRQFGPAVVIDVARSQNARAAAKNVDLPPRPVAQQAELPAPTVLPLNVSPDEYNSCCQRPSTTLEPITIVKPALRMPPVMPPRAVLPPVGQGAAAPRYNNLCWALRNGAVDQSQFDPDAFLKLQYRCNQLGYTGACIPPPNVALYLDQNRRAGTLPHITVNQSDLDAIPRAPELTGRNCAESYRLAGMGGFRGMGMTWGDSPASRCSPSAMQVQPGVNWRGMAILAAVAVGAYALVRG